MTEPHAPEPVETALLSVCISCRAADGPESDRPGEALYRALQDAAEASDGRVRVRPVQCLSVCKRPCTVALTAPGRYTYVFGDLDPLAGVGPLLECAGSYLRVEHGYLLWRERPEPLRRGIVARIPPPEWLGDDGAHPR